jgi:hypothetical protein
MSVPASNSGGPPRKVEARAKHQADETPSANARSERHERALNRGAWRYSGDRHAERAMFFNAICVRAPEVLVDLYENVFPLYLEAQKRRATFAEKMARHYDDLYGPPSDGATWGFRRFPEFCAHYDIDVWRATWDWATRHELSRGMNMDMLKSPAAFSLAEWCQKQPFLKGNRRRLPDRPWSRRLSRNMDVPLRVDRSPEITFGMPLMETVWKTLKSWDDNRPTGLDNLRWDRETFFDPRDPANAISLEALKGLHAAATGPSAFSDVFHRHRVWVTGPRLPYIHTLVVPGWRIIAGQTRREAKAAMKAAAEQQIEQILGETARKMCTKPYLEPRLDKRSVEHFEWLVLYQIGKRNYAEVSRALDPEPEGSIISDTKTKTSGIKSAAELLIGPRYVEWLRPGRRGRQPRS